MVNGKVIAGQIKFVFIYKQFFLDKGIKNSKYKITIFSRKGTNPELSCCTGRSSFHLYFKKTERPPTLRYTRTLSPEKYPPGVLAQFLAEGSCTSLRVYFMACPLVRSYSPPPLPPVNIYMLILCMFFIP